MNKIIQKIRLPIFLKFSVNFFPNFWDEQVFTDIYPIIKNIQTNSTKNVGKKWLQIIRKFRKKCLYL